MIKFIRHHVHDVRNHCLGIDLDATLLVELTDDPEITKMATRLHRQVARIELDLKLLLLKMERPRPVTLTVDDFVQLWLTKLQSQSARNGSVIWSKACGETSITLDVQFTVGALCDLSERIWDCHPGAALEVSARQEPQRVMLDLIQPLQGEALEADFLEEMVAVLATAKLRLDSALDPVRGRWVITLEIPLQATA